jgi:GH24 family phage-related lysozyme (muramidase)
MISTFDRVRAFFGRYGHSASGDSYPRTRKQPRSFRPELEYLDSRILPSFTAAASMSAYAFAHSYLNGNNTGGPTNQSQGNPVDVSASFDNYGGSISASASGSFSISDSSLMISEGSQSNGTGTLTQGGLISQGQPDVAGNFSFSTPTSVSITNQASFSDNGANTGVFIEITDDSSGRVVYSVFNNTNGNANSTSVMSLSGSYHFEVYTVAGSQIDFDSQTSTGPKSASVVFQLTLSQTATTTTVTSSANPSVTGQPVTFTATVTPTSGSGTPTGMVDFFDTTTNTALGSASLSGGVASVPTTALTIGSHSITARYGGDSTFLSSSGTLSPNQTVTAPGIDLISSIDNTNLWHHIYVGQQLAIPIVVTNQGATSASGKININLFFSPHTTLDASAVALSTLTNLSINLGTFQSQTFQAQVKIPSGPQSGTYYVLAQVNSNRKIPESDFSNNLATSQALTLCSSTGLTAAQATLYNQAVMQAKQNGPPSLPTGPYGDPGMTYTAAREGGLILFPYLDSQGIPTIGVGLNIPANRSRLQTELSLTNKQVNTLIQDANINGTVNPDGTLKSGKQPIGIGIINAAQLTMLFTETYMAAQSDAPAQLEAAGVNWATGLSANAKIALIDMDFNLGHDGFADFMGMITDLARGDIPCAAFEMMQSDWAVQVQSRAILDFRLLVTGFEQQL